MFFYRKFQKYIPFDPGSKSPLAPHFKRGESFKPLGFVFAICEFMRLQASCVPPLRKGDRGIFTVAYASANRDIFMTIAIR